MDHFYSALLDILNVWVGTILQIYFKFLFLHFIVGFLNTNIKRLPSKPFRHKINFFFEYQISGNSKKNDPPYCRRDPPACICTPRGGCSIHSRSRGRRSTPYSWPPCTRWSRGILRGSWHTQQIKRILTAKHFFFLLFLSRFYLFCFNVLLFRSKHKSKRKCSHFWEKKK